MTQLWASCSSSVAKSTESPSLTVLKKNLPPSRSDGWRNTIKSLYKHIQSKFPKETVSNYVSSELQFLSNHPSKRFTLEIKKVSKRWRTQLSECLNKRVSLRNAFYTSEYLDVILPQASLIGFWIYLIMSPIDNETKNVSKIKFYAEKWTT